MSRMSNPSSLLAFVLLAVASWRSASSAVIPSSMPAWATHGTRLVAAAYNTAGGDYDAPRTSADSADFAGRALVRRSIPLHLVPIRSNAPSQRLPSAAASSSPGASRLHQSTPSFHKPSSASNASHSSHQDRQLDPVAAAAENERRRRYAVQLIRNARNKRQGYGGGPAAPPTSVGPVYTFARTDTVGNYKWGVRHSIP